MSNVSQGMISARQDLWLVVPGEVAVPLTAGLYYRGQDPYAITVSLEVGTDEPIDWTFARDLLAGALHGPEGTGDVRAWPSAVPAVAEMQADAEEGIVTIALGSSDSYAIFETGAAGIKAFLDRTYALIPAGQETAYLNLDAELAELLGQA